MVKLAYEMYIIIKNFFKEILHDKWMGPNSKLAILGGIMINCDGEDGTCSMFLPLMFEVKDKRGNH